MKPADELQRARSLAASLRARETGFRLTGMAELAALHATAAYHAEGLISSLGRIVAAERELERRVAWEG